MHVLALLRRCPVALVLVALSARADEPARPPVEVLGIRGPSAARYHVAGEYFARLADPPFARIHGAAWSPDGRRWVLWGSDASPADASADLVTHRRSEPQRVVFGGERMGGRQVSLRHPDVPGWQLERIALARWDGPGSAVLMVCRSVSQPPARLSLGPQSLCLLLDAQGRLLAHADVSGLIVSAASSPDGRSWVLVRQSGHGTALLRWQPPGDPETLAWDLPTPEASCRVAEIAEVAWHPSDEKVLAVAYRLALSDSAWAIATLGSDGSGGRFAVRGQTSVRDVRWSPDGEYLSWISPSERRYTYHKLELTVRYEVLWRALPGYEPQPVFDLVHQTRFLRPEELTALDFLPTIESYSWSEGGIYMVSACAGPLLLPKKALWWVPTRKNPLLVFEDPSWRGPICARKE